MAKKVIFGFEAQKKLKKGFDTVADAVKVTLGASAGSVIFEGHVYPNIADDGYTVAKNIDLKDKVENMGAGLIRQIGTDTNNRAGDGTSTSMVLAQAMLSEGFKVIEAAGDSTPNITEVKAGMEQAISFVTDELDKMKITVDTPEKIKQVATVSSLDEVVGQTISDALTEIGNDGVIIVEDSNKIGIQKEVISGMRIEKGYVSPDFINEPQTEKAILTNPYVFVTDRVLSTPMELATPDGKMGILNILGQSEFSSGQNFTLLIICDRIEGGALATAVINSKNNWKIVCIEAPGFGENKKEFLRDVAAITGATLISDETGTKLKDLTPQDFGKAGKIVSEREKTIILAGGGDKTEVTDYITALKNRFTTVEGEQMSEYDKERLNKRIASLQGKICVLGVGTFSATETQAKRYKIEDAVNATKSAIEQGVVAGGGSAYIKIAQKLNNDFSVANLTNDQIIGVGIVRKALTAPLAQMSENAGLPVYNVLSQVQNSDSSMGYDFMKRDFTNLIDRGIFDPVKVLKIALQNAGSVVSTLLSTRCAVYQEEEGTATQIINYLKGEK